MKPLRASSSGEPLLTLGLEDKREEAVLSSTEPGEGAQGSASLKQPSREGSSVFSSVQSLSRVRLYATP